MALLAMSVAVFAPSARTAAPPDNNVAEPLVSEQDGSEGNMPAASETLIAAALKAGTITYEESLRQRAFALYPRYALSFRARLTRSAA